MSALTLQEARNLYAKLDAAQRAQLADAFAEAFKTRLSDGMTPEDLESASDASFIDAVRAIGGNA